MPSSAPTRVLLADPDAELRHHVADLVREVGNAARMDVAIDHATNGTMALAAIADHRPRLLISEVLLPGLSGLGLLRRIRADHGTGTAVVLVTSMTRDADRYWALRNGAHAYVTKPFDDGQLRERIRPLLLEGPEARPERIL
jgi:twitching motility two-component system response regulator PilH